MKFRTADNPRKKVRATLDLTPLIDVVFQLLIFFMLTTTFVVQSAIQIEMPEAKGPQNLEQKDLSLTIAQGDGGPDGRGPIYVNNDAIGSWSELTQRLQDEIATRPDIVLLIRIDKAVPVERLVKAMGYARSVGYKQFGLAAAPLADEG